MEFIICMDVKKHKHEIIPFIPKYVMRQTTGLVGFSFAIFCRFNKPNKLVNNK